MNKKNFPPNLSLEEREKQLLAMLDEEIDYSDIPPLDEHFLNKATLFKKQSETEQISLRLDQEVLDWFRSQGKDYQILINDVLRTYVTHKQEQLKE